MTIEITNIWAFVGWWWVGILVGLFILWLFSY